MFKQKRLTVLSMAVVLALLVAAVMPFTALADDGAPPPPDVPVVDVAPTEEPVVDAAPTEVPVVDVPPTESVSDVVAALADANAVLLDADGNPIPLASQEAVEALTALDPYIVRAGVTHRFLTNCTGQPVNDTNTCTVSSTPIQAAIDFAVAGETVLVEPGTYYGSVVIDKPLTLRSTAGAATTIIDGNNANENFYVVQIASSDVTLDGFTVTNPLYSNSADASGIINQWWKGTFSNIRITNNVIHDIGTLTRPSVSFGTFGINIGPVDGIEIDNNSIFNIGNNDPNSSAIGIFSWGSSPDTANNIFIHDNVVYDISHPTLADGINAGGDSANVVIDNNTVTGPLRRGGIVTSAFLDGPATITNNTVSGTSLYGLLLRSPFQQTVTGNTITDATTGIQVNDTTDTDSLTIQSNSITGNGTGINNSSTGNGEVVNASANWFGSNDPAVVGAAVSANVDYTPWLDSGTDTSADPGFQGDFSVLNVDDDSPQTGTIGHIQEAVDMVTGSTVNMMAGTYTEDVEINGKDGFTLQGAGSSNTTITGTGGLWAHNNTGTLTLQDFAVTGSDVDGIFVEDHDGAIVLSGINSSGNGSPGGDGWWIGGAWLEATGAVTVSNSEFSNNADADRATGLYIQSPAGPITLNNVVAAGNSDDGIDIYTDGNVTLNNVTSTGNGYDGVFVDGYDNSTWAGTVTVNGGTFTGNGDGTYTTAYGLRIYACQLSMDGAQTFGGNQTANVFFGQNPACVPAPSDDEDTTPIVPLPPLAPAAIAETVPLTLAELPGALPEGKTFVAGISVITVGSGQVSFDIPEDAVPPFTILFWDGTQWVEIPSTVVDGQVVFTVTQPGVYVLVAG